jgi:hypothetical protein
VNVRRRVAVVLVLALTLAGVAPPAGGTTAAGVSDGARGFPAVESNVGALQAENNTTRHRDPETVGEDGNLAAIRSNLAGRMGEISVDCSEGIRVGNYDACEELNGSYSDALSKYVDVTGREAGGNEDDSESAESFDDLQEEQREFANETREYRRTYREYREARRNGNTTRARRLARELINLNRDIQRTGGNVSRTSDEVTNLTGVSLVAVRQNTEAVSANVSNTTNSVITVVFVPTAMTATRTGTGAISARDPLVVTGEVRTADGAPVANGSVVLTAGPGRDSRVVARTEVAADNGTYRLQYRPTAIRTGDRTLSVRYRPTATSVYLPANESVAATVEGIRANVSLGTVSDEARYRDPVRADVRLTTIADGEQLGLQGVPLDLRVDGRTLADGRTNPSGALALAPRLPAGVGSGDRTLTLVGPTSNRAVTIESVRRPLRVDSTATTLDARAVQTGAGARSLRVVGQLRARGQGVPGQELEVRIDGRLVRTLETNATGDYRRTVPIPNASFPATGRDAVDVVVAFDGAGTNLEGASASRQVTVRSGEVASADGRLARPLAFMWANPFVVGAAGIAITGLLAAGVFVLLRRRGAEDSTGGVEGGAKASGSDGSKRGASEKLSEADVETVREALSDGAYARAVLSGYATLRRGLPVTDAPSVTHWEFYRRASESGLPEAQLDALRDVTEAFEQVSFAGRPPDEAEAASVVEAVRNALREREGEGGPVTESADD